MVCSACGFENQAAMRFCGMCGMPLPHRPMTAPGAQSTLNFTRVPVDARLVARERSATTEDGGGVLLEIPASANGAGVETRDQNPGKGGVQEADSNLAQRREDGNLREREPQLEDEAQDGNREQAWKIAEPPAKELVPDVPLNEYVQSFHYDPPKDPAEVTMRGDARVAAPEATVQAPPATESKAVKPPENIIASASPVAQNIIASSSAGEVKAPVGAAPVASTEDVDRRLGLEPESATEARIARPRFLDINEPPEENKSTEPREMTPANSGTSTIAGPSFLGLSDAPQTWIEAVGVDEEYGTPRNRHWRAWLAVAVVVLLGGLAFLEWRAQSNQTNNGPVEVIRTKFRNLRNKAEAQINGQTAAEPAGGDPNAKPEMQVEEQPKPQTPQPNANGGTATGGTPAQTATGQPGDQPAGQAVTTQSGSESASTPPSQNAAAASKPATPPADDASKIPAAPQQKVATASDNGQPSAAPEKPKAKRQVDEGDDQGVTTRQIAPGADELAKAKNASDSAASAAWLWKATAKGNPQAPVQLADMYIQGDGVPRSCEQALVLLKTAAEKENAPARNRLASMYSTGTCVQRNRVEAYRWLSSALTANPNSQWAQQNRDLIWQQMSADERAEAQKYR